MAAPPIEASTLRRLPAPLGLAVELEHADVSRLQLDTAEESNLALGRAAALCLNLPNMLPGDPMQAFGSRSSAGLPTAGAAAQQVPAANSARDLEMAAKQGETAACARGIIERALKLPPDTPKSDGTTHAFSMLVARQVELCAATAAKVITSSLEAAQALQNANPTEQASVLKQHAQGLRKLGTMAGEALNDQLAIGEGDRQGIGAQVSTVTGMYLREVEKLSDAARRTLEGIGSIVDLRKGVENIGQRLMAEGASYEAFARADDKVSKQYAAMARQLRDVMGRVDSSSGPAIATVALNHLVQRAFVDREITQGKMWLGWLQARVDGMPPGTLNATDLVELKGTAEFADAAMVKTGRPAR